MNPKYIKINDISNVYSISVGSFKHEVLQISRNSPWASQRRKRKETLCLV